MIDFHYKTYGEKSNQPLLMLHGFLGSHKEFDDHRRKLSKQFYLIIPDLPGHGQTKVSEPEEFSMPVCAGELVRLLDSLEIKKSHVVSYSMGGRLALYLVVNYPERFDKIILESSSPGLKTSEEQKARIETDLKLADRINKYELSDFIATWNRLPLFKTIDKSSERYKTLLLERLNNDKTGLSRSLERMGTGAQPSLWENLSEIKNDLLLIVGESDDKFINIAIAMKKENSQFELNIISGASHNVHFEQPDEFIRSVQQFLIK